MTSKGNSTPKKRAVAPAAKLQARNADRYDVVIVGAGPAGSTLAWRLASQGVKTLLLDSAHFPREKVCGDFVEPRGLSLLDKMGCLQTLQETFPLPIEYSSTYIDSKRCYIGRIPFYGVHKHLPPHGYIVPRDILDKVILETAVAAGTAVRQETSVSDFKTDKNGVTVDASCRGTRIVYQGRIIVGADGVNSVVARKAGLLVNDPRHIALSQRAYADGYEGEIGEAAFFFDGDFFPGYGWMFPMRNGRVNLGVGVLKETCQRAGIAVPGLFHEFFEKLKRSHPRCGKLKLVRPPIGGIVKTYGGAGPNYFDKGLLIGDAGCFVDPMTGEGITPAMESGLIASQIIVRALRKGHLNSLSFSDYEKAYRSYFDPSMIFADLCAAALRNPNYWESWKRALVRGCELSQRDTKFAATAGACFGGLEINPSAILAELWTKTAESLLGTSLQSILDLADGRTGSIFQALHYTTSWIGDSWGSILEDPLWHASWTVDVQRKWIHAVSIMGKQLPDPRIKGLI